MASKPTGEIHTNLKFDPRCLIIIRYLWLRSSESLAKENKRFNDRETIKERACLRTVVNILFLRERKKVLFKADHQFFFFHPKLIVLQKCSLCWLRCPEDFHPEILSRHLKVGNRLTLDILSLPQAGRGGAKKQAD